MKSPHRLLPHLYTIGQVNSHRVNYCMVYLHFTVVKVVAGWRHALRSEWPFIIIIKVVRRLAVHTMCIIFSIIFLCAAHSHKSITNTIIVPPVCSPGNVE